jgi:hypothetical protein
MNSLSNEFKSSSRPGLIDFSGRAETYKPQLVIPPTYSPVRSRSSLSHGEFALMPRLAHSPRPLRRWPVLPDLCILYGLLHKKDPWPCGPPPRMKTSDVLIGVRTSEAVSCGLVCLTASVFSEEIISNLQVIFETKPG